MVEVAAVLAGGVGAACRFIADEAVRRRVGTRWPYAIMAINLVGSFLLGLVTGAVAHGHLAPGWRLVAGTGLCGGFTTFSTASLDAVRLAGAGRRGDAVKLVVGVAVAAIAAAAAGLILG